MQEILNLNKNNCTDCYKCIRDCSVKAITFANATAEIVHNDCILCGRCYVTCPQKAKQVRNDVLRVKAAIIGGRRVVCSLAPSFIANFRIRSLDVITQALKALGFAEVQETAIGAQLVSEEYARIMEEGKLHVLISSCCPSINMLIKKYYPTMLPYLAKVLTPMEAHCKLIKQQQPDAFTVFIGPCIAKKKEGDENAYIDAVSPYELVRHSFAEFTDEEGHSHVTFAGTLRYAGTENYRVQGSGNGPIDAFFNAVHGLKIDRFTFVDYKSHAITDGSDSMAVAYIQLRDPSGKDIFGVGVSHNINLAPLKGILSAINRAVSQ